MFANIIKFIRNRTRKLSNQPVNEELLIVLVIHWNSMINNLQKPIKLGKILIWFRKSDMEQWFSLIRLTYTLYMYISWYVYHEAFP